ncbi:MAG: HemK2/MTQ2 family protein methyltransferase [Candidatus Nanohaloarchaea archaeon]
MIYPIREDTLFFKNFLAEKDLTDLELLEIGTGNGQLAITAAKKGAKVTATDIHEPSLKETKRKALEEGIEENIELVKSNLFSEINSKFDIIIFNPPYLPGEKAYEGRTWKGGKEGIEITERFLNQVNDYLKSDSEAYIIASNKANIEKLIERYNLSIESEKKLWFEKLLLLKSK